MFLYDICVHVYNLLHVVALLVNTPPVCSLLDMDFVQRPQLHRRCTQTFIN